MHIYLVEIGGLRSGSLFESHEVHALFAENEAELIDQCRDRFCDVMQSPHIDGWTRFAIEERPEGESPLDRRFFLLELGQNAPGYMRERHDYRFVTASDGKEAARTVRQSDRDWHIDAVVDLDALAEGQGYALCRSGDAQPTPDHIARYIRLLSHG